jgi:DNA-binding NtrC family response regulator
MTAYGSVDIAVDVMRHGADDFLQKPIEQSRLITTAKNLLEKKFLKSQVDELEATYKKKQYHGFIGSSESMQKVYRMINSVAKSQASVFITGESGTGKEVCASAIHEQSDRKDRPFIALNCSAIPKDLIESEIFGHVKGAFTGAISEREGAAQQADGGTLFLDEIGEMDMSLQTKLLRFVQTGIVRKLGGAKDDKLNVRFLCATNKNPIKEIEAGNFREDLYYRLNVVPIHLVPLRERGNDVLELAEYFLNQYALAESKEPMDLSAASKQIFLAYDWPGNARQLQNVIHNSVVFNDKALINVEDLPSPLDCFSSAPNKEDFHKKQVVESSHSSNHFLHNAEPMNNSKTTHTVSDFNANSLNYYYFDERGKPVVRSLADIERDIIEGALSLYDDNILKAASFLEVSPSTIYRKKNGWEQREIKH